MIIYLEILEAQTTAYANKMLYICMYTYSTNKLEYLVIPKFTLLLNMHIYKGHVIGIIINLGNV